MDVLEATEHLIEEKLRVVISQGLVASDDTLKIGLHQVVHQIDVLEMLLRRWLQDCVYADNVLMLK